MEPSRLLHAFHTFLRSIATALLSLGAARFALFLLYHYDIFLSIGHGWEYFDWNFTRADKNVAQFREEVVARFVAEQVYHCAHMLALVEGFGVPVWAALSNARAFQVYRDVIHTEGAARPRRREPFANLILDYSNKIRSINHDLHDVSHHTVDDFRSGKPLNIHLSEALDILQTAHRQLADGPTGPSSNSSGKPSAAEAIRQFLTAVPQQLTTKMAHIFQQRAAPLDMYLSKSRNVSLAGWRLMRDLNAEITRVDQELDRLPWYDAWRMRQILNMSKTEALKQYSEALRKSEKTLQYLAEAVDISRENVVSLSRYIQWFQKDMPRNALDYQPSDLGSMAEEVTALRRATADLFKRADLLYGDIQTSTDMFVPKQDPRRVSAGVALDSDV